MTDKPTMWDFINWQRGLGERYTPAREGLEDVNQDGEINVLDIMSGLSQGSINEGQIGDLQQSILHDVKSSRSQQNIGNYLSDLLQKSGKFDTSLTSDNALKLLLSEEGEQYSTSTGLKQRPDKKTFSGELSLDPLSEIYSRDDFRGMSREDLTSSIMDVYSDEFSRWEDKMGSYKQINPETGSVVRDFGGDLDEAYDKYLYYESNVSGYNPEDVISKEDFAAQFGQKKYKDVDFESGDLDALLNYMQGMQEGFGSMKTFEEYGGERKIADVEKEAERDVKSAYQGYIPGEIISRYSSLQGKGKEAQGELAESEYLSKVSAADRRKGRETRSIYDEYESGLFDDLANWIS